MENEKIEKEIKRINEKLDCLFAQLKKEEKITIEKASEIKTLNDIRYCVRKTKFDIDMREIREKIEENKRKQKDLEQELQYLYNEQQAIEHRYYNCEE